MRELEFFYDFVSPYSYLASTRVEAIAARAGATVRFRPFLLGAVHKAAGIQAPYQTAAKALHMWVDLRRWARRLDVPLVFPSSFPVGSILSLRTALAAEAQGKLVPFTHAVYRAFWGEGRGLDDPELLAELASGLGMDGKALVASAPEYKAALATNTQSAIDRGSFGAPTFFVGDEMFIGNDRLDFVEEALRQA